MRFYFYLLLLFTIGLIDWRWRRIPHWLTLPAIVGACLCAVWLPALHWLNASVGGGIALGLFGLIRVIANRYYKTRAMGFGDVLVATLIGAIGGIKIGLWALTIGMLVAGLAAGLTYMRGADAQTRLPYATYLALGATGTFVLVRVL